MSVDADSVTAEEVDHVDTQDVRNLHERADAGVCGAGLDRLIGGAAELCGEEHALLGAVLLQSGYTDAVADSPALLSEPVVVGGQAWHSTHARLIMILSQPGKPGIL